MPEVLQADCVGFPAMVLRGMITGQDFRGGRQGEARAALLAPDSTRAAWKTHCSVLNSTVLPAITPGHLLVPLTFTVQHRDSDTRYQSALRLRLSGTALA